MARSDRDTLRQRLLDIPIAFATYTEYVQLKIDLRNELERLWEVEDEAEKAGGDG